MREDEWMLLARRWLDGTRKGPPTWAAPMLETRVALGKLVELKTGIEPVTSCLPCIPPCVLGMLPSVT